VEEVFAAKEAEFGSETMRRMFSQLCLQIIDSLWVDHLEMMGHIRSSVNLRAYGQRDPLIEYRREGTEAFKDLEATILHRIAEVIPVMQPAVIEKEEVAHQKEAEAALKASEGGESKTTPRVAETLPGRNDIVTITNGTKTESMKYKKAEPLLAEGWQLVSK
jgi:preprotein translocase subunit SecA